MENKSVLKVVKIGGNIIDNAEALTNFLRDFATITEPKILIHGGGKLATKLAHQINVQVEMINGRRITNAETLDIITMVYAGKINKNVVAKLQGFGCNSVGFSGADGNSIVSVKRPVKDINFGFVGDVVNVNTEVANALINHKITPVFCAISHDGNGQLFNTNADTIASEIAKAFADIFDVELYYCFEKNGVLENIDDDNSVVKHINSESYEALKNNGIIVDGMLPKLDNCFNAVHNSVAKVCIGKPSMLFQNNTKYTTITV